MKIVAATRNPDKLSEIRDLLESLPVTVVAIDALGDFPDVIEDRETLAGNARKKARQAVEQTGLPALADDTGLEVDALEGRPGVRSARFAGPEASYDDNNRKLLAALKDVPENRRTARFRTVIAFATPEGEADFEVEGRLEGRILSEPRGEHGFGYDPLFYVPDRDRSLAELPSGEKNRISHRARALEAFRTQLESRLIEKA